MNKKGFTLIELMIVIAIISILASIIVPNITRARARAQLTACIANLKQILTAYNMFKADNPSQDLGGCDSIQNQTEIYPDYISTVPHCPAGSSTSNCYFINSCMNSGGEDFAILCGACGPPSTNHQVILGEGKCLLINGWGNSIKWCPPELDM